MQIRVDELPDGGMIAGKVGDDDVLLARRGDEYFALDAHCTHWHGPLAEGVLVGETVRCPWHHACFDLRTGVAIAAPAMRPLRTFTVTREGDIVRVSSVAQSRGRAVAQQNHPSTAQPRDRATEDAAPQHIVILGAGSAGSFAAHELRRNGFAGRVTLISREERLPYDKPNLSKDYLAGKAPAEWIPLQTEDEYAANNIELRLNTTVESIDAQRRELRLANGETLAYDKLILATGATARRRYERSVRSHHRRRRRHSRRRTRRTRRPHRQQRCGRRRAPADQRPEHLRRRRHRQPPQHAHRTLGGGRAAGTSRGAQRDGKGRTDQRRAVLLEPALRPLLQLRRPRDARG